MHVHDIFNVKKLANSNLMQVYIEFLIRFSSTSTKFLIPEPAPIHLWLDHTIIVFVKLTIIIFFTVNSQK